MSLVREVVKVENIVVILKSSLVDGTHCRNLTVVDFTGKGSNVQWVTGLLLFPFENVS